VEICQVWHFTGEPNRLSYLIQHEYRNVTMFVHIIYFCRLCECLQHCK